MHKANANYRQLLTALLALLLATASQLAWAQPVAANADQIEGAAPATGNMTLTCENKYPTEVFNAQSVQADATNVYVATTTGLAVSNDGGSTYTIKTSADGLGAAWVNDLYLDGSTLYAATQGGLSISTDNGNSFTTKTTADGLASGSTQAVYANGNAIYVATFNGLSVSTDGGNSFTTYTQAANGLASNFVNDVYVAGSTIYAATGQGLSISTNGGTSFSNTSLSQVVAVYAVGNTVYVVAYQGLYISTDGGSTFSSVDILIAEPGLGAIDIYINGSTIYVATLGGLRISTDGGATFTAYTVTSGLGSNYVYGVYAVGSTIYAATYGGISISTNGGTTFSNYTTITGIGSSWTGDVYFDDPNLYVANGNGLARSTDSGATFTTYPNANGLRGAYVNVVKVIGSILFAGSMTGLSISSDGGATFSHRTTAHGLGHNEVYDVEFMNGLLYVATRNGLAISADGGNTFTNRTTVHGLRSNLVKSIDIVGNTVYAGAGGLNVSTDYGATFSNGNSDFIETDIIVMGNTIYGTGNGLNISTDGGATFTQRTTADGLGNNITLDVNVTSDGTIYVATTGGLSISTDGGTSFTNFTTAHGLSDDHIRAVYVAGSTIYIATVDGFSICGLTITGPEIDVQGNGISIVSGDSTPTSTDDTDFGSADLNTEVVYHTFTIKNTGDAPLNLSGNPVVAVSGHVFDFIVTSQPATPIAAGGESTFTVVFNPYDLGTRTATISIANDDSDENPYTFAVQGVGITTAPEIDVQGNGLSIVGGDSTPSTTDDTDFGSADLNTEVVYHTFTIKNTGDAPLNLSGNPVVAVSGHFIDFTVTSQPATPIAAGGESTFTVVFNPYDLGTRTATISIANNDSDENLYTFAVQGVGITTAPEIDVQGNGMSIVSGDSTPTSTDYTDFGSVGVVSDAKVHSFYIYNLGDGPLNLTGDPIVTITGDHANDFSALYAPTDAIAAGSFHDITVTFDPSAAGLRTATISIANNDSDEDPYTFAIQGVGTVVCSATMSAATATELNDAIGCFNNQSTPGTYIINLSADITLNADTEIDNANSGVQLQINGNGNALDGNNSLRGLTIAADTWVAIDRLTIRNGSGLDGAGIYNQGMLTVANSTLNNNAAIYYGGGLFSTNPVTISNSTFSNNSAGDSGGAIYSNGILTVHNSTFSNSAANSGGGLYNKGTLTLNNTIIANSSSGGDCVNAGSGTVTSQTNNLIEDSANACGISHGTNGTIVGQDPLLGPLVDNGGATQTHAILAGSPAIDAGDNAICAAAPVNNLDQRGTVRPQGSACDIGAVEQATTNLGADNKVSQDGVATSYNPTPTACANLSDLPIHTINSTVSNSSSDTFSDLYFALTALEYVEPQGDYQPTLCNADGGNGGRVDARLSLPLTGDLADNLFAPTESTTFALDVGLPVRKRYRIFGNLYGIPVAVQAAEDAAVQHLGTFGWEFDEEGNLVDTSVQIFLPVVVK